MTKQQQQAILHILRKNNGKNPARPALGHGHRSNGATYFCDGCRIVKSTDDCDSPLYTIFDRDDAEADTCDTLVRFWEDYEQNFTERTEITLPTLDELAASREKFVDVGEYCFTRKYLRDFIKVCKAKTGEIIVKYSCWRGERWTYCALKGATPDGKTECVLLPVRKPKNAA